MALIILFGGTLIVASLISEFVGRSILSTTILFLGVGYAFGEWGTPLVPPVSNATLGTVSTIALFVILFTDGMHIHFKEMKTDASLTIRALAIGMPLTAILSALFCNTILGFSWVVSLLIGTILAPTDPVFSAALIGNHKVPARLRHLLNIESGINDGIALPFIVILVAIAKNDSPHYGHVALELIGGVFIGIVIPVVAIFLEKSKLFATSKRFAPLHIVGIGILVFGVCGATGANPFLAAFAAGIACRSAGMNLAKEFSRFGDDVGEIVKLFAVLIFAMQFGHLNIGIPGAYIFFGLLVVFISRPIAILLALTPNELTRPELYSAMWFGPKGFASISYGILVLESGTTNAEKIFSAIAVAVVLSIILHSSTDTMVARSFENAEKNDV